MYQELYLFIKKTDVEFGGLIASALLLIAICAEVDAVFVTIRLRKIALLSIPLYSLYSIFPFLALFIPILCGIIVPAVVQVHDGSEKFLIELKHKLKLNWNAKYYKRKVRSLRPCGYHSSIWNTNLFLFRHSTKATFFKCMGDYTCSCLVSIPQRIIDRVILHYALI